MDTDLIDYNSIRLFEYWIIKNFNQFLMILQWIQFKLDSNFKKQNVNKLLVGENILGQTDRQTDGLCHFPMLLI